MRQTLQEQFEAASSKIQNRLKQENGITVQEFLDTVFPLSVHFAKIMAAPKSDQEKISDINDLFKPNSKAAENSPTPAEIIQDYGLRQSIEKIATMLVHDTPNSVLNSENAGDLLAVAYVKTCQHNASAFADKLKAKITL